jgi:hypothetical protein
MTSSSSRHAGPVLVHPVARRAHGIEYQTGGRLGHRVADRRVCGGQASLQGDFEAWIWENGAFPESRRWRRALPMNRALARWRSAARGDVRERGRYATARRRSTGRWRSPSPRTAPGRPPHGPWRGSRARRASRRDGRARCLYGVSQTGFVHRRAGTCRASSTQASTHVEHKRRKSLWGRHLRRVPLGLSSRRSRVSGQR